MSILNRIGKLFGMGKPTLKSLSVDDLRREHVSVESEWNKLIDEKETIDADEGQLQEEYKVAHTTGRLPLKRTIAQKIQHLQLKRKGIETRLAYATRMMHAVNGLLTIMENMVFFEKLGVGSLLAQMDLAELERFVLDATIEGTLHQDKLAAALREVTRGVDDLAEASNDTDIDAFMNDLDARLLDSPSDETENPHDNIGIVAEKSFLTAQKTHPIRQSNEQESVQ